MLLTFHSISIRSVVASVRPGKVDSLFPISHFLNFDAGGRSLFIIHYDITILQCILKYFSHRKITSTNTGNHKPVTNVAFKANSSDPAWNFS